VLAILLPIVCAGLLLLAAGLVLMRFNRRRRLSVADERVHAASGGR
jgi:hypothetical protein